VFALRLNRRKFAKNPNDSIWCKFSIDREFRSKTGAQGASTISKPYQARFWKPVIHHPHRLNPQPAAKTPSGYRLWLPTRAP
jgi:hypothetical protein